MLNIATRWWHDWTALTDWADSLIDGYEQKRLAYLRAENALLRSVEKLDELCDSYPDINRELRPYITAALANLQGLEP